MARDKYVHPQYTPIDFHNFQMPLPATGVAPDADGDAAAAADDDDAAVSSMALMCARLCRSRSLTSAYLHIRSEV
jgi:hypothetical protein